MTLNLTKFLQIKKLNTTLEESDFLLYSFYGSLIKKGQKEKSQVIFKELLIFLKKEYPDQNPLDILIKGLLKLKPVVNLRLKKVAGINYQLPCPINNEKSIKIAVKWFFSSLDSRNEKTLLEKIKKELLELLQGKGVSMQKKESLEKLALDNRPFVFFLKR